MLWEHGCRGVLEEAGEVVGYFDSLAALPLSGNWEELPDEDYQGRYFLGLEPVSVGPLVVAPTHREAVLQAGQKPLWIDPGMAFGTGHHETTRLALQSLGDIALAGKSVLDVGSGSGILGIAADLLGAGAALGVDNDPETVPIARENARLNRSRARFEARGISSSDRADLVVANLHAELHVELAPAYALALPPGGTLLVTGILAERSDIVPPAFAPWFEPVRWRDEGEWRLLEAVRNEDGLSED